MRRAASAQRVGLPQASQRCTKVTLWRLRSEDRVGLPKVRLAHGPAGAGALSRACSERFALQEFNRDDS